MMVIVLKSVKFIFLKIPVALILAVLFVFRFLFQYLSGVIAVLLRIVGSIVILASVLMFVLELTTTSQMIWSVIGGAMLILLPFVRSAVLLFLCTLIEGLKLFLFRG